MGNVYSVHNVAAYFIEELNTMHKFVSEQTLQQLLVEVDAMWKKAFGHCAFHEQAISSNGSIVFRGIQQEYALYGSSHIASPAMEWYLPYGTFQLILRPYVQPTFSAKENILLHKAIARIYKAKKQALAG